MFVGLDNFKSDVQKMLGHTPNLYWRICWKIVSPAFLFVSTKKYILRNVPLFFNHTLLIL